VVGRVAPFSVFGGIYIWNSVKLGEDPPHEFVCAGFLEWTPNYFDRKHKAGKSCGGLGGLSAFSRGLLLASILQKLNWFIVHFYDTEITLCHAK